MRVAVLGYGRQGQSAAEYWYNIDPKNTITICDANADLEVPAKFEKQLGKNYLKNLGGFDIIVRGPSVHPANIAKANTAEILQKVTTTSNEFIRICPTKNIIGVTGTKGKGTTSTLIAKILEADGKTVHLGGNIGIDPLLLLKENIKPDDWVVLELANFQLIDLKVSPHIAVCLMTVPEHLDWHSNLDEYYRAKTNLFANQTKKDIAIYNENYESSKYIASFSKGHKIGFDVPQLGTHTKMQNASYVSNGNIYHKSNLICSINDVSLFGRHNLENICAAISAIWGIVENKNMIKKVICEPLNLQHRLELVATINNVRYYNDSLSTTPETTIAAIKSFTESKILILGGSSKGIDLEPITKACIKNNVRYCVLIGQTADQLSKYFIMHGLNNFSIVNTNMKDVVACARKHSQKGDVVLLSPGCASFGLFKDYEDRANQFKNAVYNMAKD